MKKLAYVVAVCLAVGCGPDVAPTPGGGGSGGEPDGPLYLSIVGEQNVAIAEGESWVLSVKYHDAAGHAVTGRVSFAANGTTNGGHLDLQSAMTDSLGIAQVNVTGGTEAAFDVQASAAKANMVDWQITVRKPAPPPLRWAGIYHVESQLDVGGGFSGGLGDAFRTIDDLTDDQYDPATWLIDQALAQINDPTITSIVNAFRPALDQELYNQIVNAAPDLVGSLREIGQDVSAVARRFGLGSDLDVEAHVNIDGTQTVVEKHTLKSVIFTLQAQRYEFTFQSLQMPEPIDRDIPGAVEMDTTLRVGEHAFDVSYGRLLLVALDNVIIPALDPNASSISQFLNDQVDCSSIGQSISSFVGFGSQQFWTNACTGAITAVGNLIESQILRLDDTAGHLDWHGYATLVDHDGNRVVESLQPGRWIGTFVVAGQTSTLPDSSANSFVGTRTSP